MGKFRVRSVHGDWWEETLYHDYGKGSKEWLLQIEMHALAFDVDRTFPVSKTEARKWLTENGFRNLVKPWYFGMHRRKRQIRKVWGWL